MKRRNFIQSISIGLCASALNVSANTYLPKTNKTRVIVIGGGIGGINTAQSIKANDPENKIEVIILERNKTYFACINFFLYRCKLVSLPSIMGKRIKILQNLDKIGFNNLF